MTRTSRGIGDHFYPRRVGRGARLNLDPPMVMSAYRSEDFICGSSGRPRTGMAGWPVCPALPLRGSSGCARGGWVVRPLLVEVAHRCGAGSWLWCEGVSQPCLDLADPPSLLGVTTLRRSASTPHVSRSTLAEGASSYPSSLRGGSRCGWIESAAWPFHRRDSCSRRASNRREPTIRAAVDGGRPFACSPVLDVSSRNVVPRAGVVVARTVTRG